MHSEKKDEDVSPFYAKIITPDTLKERHFHKDTMTPENRYRKPQREEHKKTFDTKGKIEPTKPNAVIDDTKRNNEPKQQDLQTGTTEQPQQKLPSDKDYSDIPMQKGSQDLAQKHPFNTKSLKEKLFDNSVIEQFAKREKQKEKSDVTFDTHEFKYSGYMQRLKEKIEHIWKYPPDAAEKGIYGDLYIRFTIKKNGQLGAIELIRTSGFKILDDAAIKALKDAEPFWPLPEEWGKDGFTITGHFIYSLYGAYIR